MSIWIVWFIFKLNVSLTRIRDFLLKEEINDSDITHFKQASILIIFFYFIKMKFTIEL